MRTQAIALLALLTVSCASAPTSNVAGGNDGATIESAIVIEARGEAAGVQAEYRWLAEHYPGYERGSQSVINLDGRMYDKIDFRTAQGERRTVFFDITSYFGKW